jgi:hypothetical protein
VDEAAIAAAALAATVAHAPSVGCFVAIFQMITGAPAAIGATAAAASCISAIGIVARLNAILAIAAATTSGRKIMHRGNYRHGSAR